MKKLFTIFTLILTVLLCLGLASCVSGGEKETTAGEHEHVWDEGTVVATGSCDAATKEETKGQIRYTCTVCGETRIEETDGHTWDNGKVLDEATCVKAGQMLYSCTVCNSKKTEVIRINPTAHKLEKTDVRIVTPPTATTLGVSERACTLCGTAVNYDVTLADYSTAVTTAKNKAAAFETSAFGSGSIRADLGNAYAAPPVSPTAGQHPRVLFTRASVEGIKAELYSTRSIAAASVFRLAAVSKTDGKLPNQSKNFSAGTLNTIQAMALDYALTGNQVSGYSAIAAIKNVLTTLQYDGMSDSTRY